MGTDCVFVSISDKQCTSYGIAALPPYFKETTESVIQVLQSLDLAKFQDISDLPIILNYISGQTANCAPARAALEVSLYDLASRQKGISLSNYLGLGPYTPVKSAFTISAEDASEVKRLLDQAAEFEVLKLKMGMNGEWEILSELRRLSDKKIFADVNQGWKSKEQSLENTLRLKDYNVEFVEEPFYTQEAEDYGWLKERSPIPVFIDEHIWNLKDLEIWGDHVDGINIKLMKSGGITEAREMIVRAREKGLRVMIGCMAEGSCSLSSAACLAMLADYCDLDAAAMVSNDPFRGISYLDGKVHIESSIGNGIELIPGIISGW